jgi:hypothetical protein
MYLIQTRNFKSSYLNLRLPLVITIMGSHHNVAFPPYLHFRLLLAITVEAHDVAFPLGFPHPFNQLGEGLGGLQK